MMAYLKNSLFWVVAAFALAFLLSGVEALTWKLLFQAVFIGTVNFLIFNKNTRDKIARLILRKKYTSTH